MTKQNKAGQTIDNAMPHAKGSLMPGSRVRPVLRDVTVNLAYFLWFYAVAAVLMYWSYKDMSLVYAIVAMILPFAVMWLLRRYCKNILLFLAGHIVLIVLVMMGIGYVSSAGLVINFGGLDVNFFMVFNFVFMFMLTLYSFRVRFPARVPQYDTGATVFFTLTLVVLCILCEYSGYSPHMAALLTFIMLALLALKYLFSQMYNLDTSMELISQSYSQPVSAIISFNNKLIIGFIIFITAAAAVVYRLGLGSGLLAVSSWIGHGIVKLLRMFFGLFGNAPPPQEEAYVAESVEMTDMLAPYMLEESAHVPMFWVVLEKLLVYVGLAVGVAAAVAALIYGGYQLYKLFGEPRENPAGDVTESVAPDLVESIKARFSFSGSRPSHLARRVFYRKVRQHMRRGSAKPAITPSDTPWDMAEKIKASENIDALTSRYEQARYAERE